MQIAITSTTATLHSAVCAEFTQSSFLLILTVTDSGEVLSCFPWQIKQSGDAAANTARTILIHRCEAVLTGGLPQKAFDLLADAGITRYRAVGLKVGEALQAMNERLLDFIRSAEDGDGCSGHHHR